MIQIFLSHNTRDRKWGEWLMRSAAAHDIRPYLAEHDGQPGGLLVPKIEKAIDASAAVVVLITDNSLNSVFVQHEVGYSRKAKKLIIPVVQVGITGEQLGMLQGIEYVPFDFANPHEGHAQLTAAMHDLAQKHAQKSGDKDLVLAAAFACLLLLMITLDS
jgi:TIR domain